MTFADDALAAEHAAAYDAWADTFAERTAQMPPELAALGSRVLERFSTPPRVLDVGCGPGRDMAWFEERGATVVGVDVSPRMLELARRRCAGELLRMDMRKLLLPGEAFGLVWSIASLLHLPKTDAPTALQEFRRVVLPDGVVVVAVKRGTGERWEQPGDAPRRLFARYETDEFRALLAEAGLDCVEIGITMSDRGEEWLHAVAVRG